ncbi:hypothetical protein AB0J72_28365 [Dactylosporangium sp. NPDC049742]|uniref:hypothetical protein n=1 Tax=Dactylosporangium sp. NPDC049742 TaxID=3154737 RepID=UPI00342A266F
MQPPPPPRPSRVFRANDIATGRAVLDGYPFRYIVIGPSMSFSTALGAAVNPSAGQNAMLDEVLTAVEYLETRGWELVSMDQGFVACLRRVAR